MFAWLLRTIASSLIWTLRFAIEVLAKPHATQNLAMGFTLGMVVGIVPKATVAWCLLILLVVATPCTLWAVMVSALAFGLLATTALANVTVINSLGLAAILLVPTYLVSLWLIEKVKRPNPLGFDEPTRGANPRPAVPRGRFVAERLLVLALLFLFVFQGPRAGSYRYTTSGYTLPSDGVLSVHGLRVTDPRSSTNAILEADQADLTLDTAAYRLHGRLFITEGTLGGLRFHVPHQPAKPHAAGAPALDSRVAMHCRQALDAMRRVLEAEPGDTSPNEGVSTEALRRLPSEYRQLEQRVAASAVRIEHLGQIIEEMGDNPLRDVPSYQRAAGELEQLTGELIELRTHATWIRRNAASEQAAIRQAADRAREGIAARFHFTPLDGESLSRCLPRPDLAHTVETLLGWVQAGRGWLPRPGMQPRLHSADHHDVLFAQQRTAGLSIQKLALEGTAQVGNQGLPLTGTIEHLRWPANPAEPTVVRVMIPGTFPVAVEAVLDRTGKTPHDRIRVTCPTWPHAGRTLGSPDVLVLSAQRCLAAIQLEIDVVGNDLSGKIVIQEDGQALSLANRQASQLDQIIDQELAQIARNHSELTLSGTLQRPHWALQGSLGHDLAQSLNARVEQTLAQWRQELTAALDEETSRACAQLQALADRQLADVLQSIDRHRGRVAQIKRVLGGYERIREEVIGQGVGRSILRK